jgi:hypothetical protein
VAACFARAADAANRRRDLAGLGTTTQVPEPFLRSMKELGWEEVEEQREDGFDGVR